MEQSVVCSIFLVKREEEVRTGPPMYPVGMRAAVEVKVNLKLKSAWSPQGSTVERSFAEQIKDQDNSVVEILMNQTRSQFHREKVDRSVEYG